MARTRVVVIEDDIDGGPAAEQLTFSIDGVSYEIDLNESNARQLRDLFDPFIVAGRRTGGRLRRSSPSATRRPRTPRELQDIRDWARSNGHSVADRGRIPQSILDAYANTPTQ